jgi:PKHD-type hydroxylase
MDVFNLLNKNSSLVNYYYYSKAFNNEEIDKILEISRNYQTFDGNVSDKIDYNYRRSKVSWLKLNDETHFIYEKIIYLMKEANKIMWNFNITNLIEPIQLSEYNEGSENETPGHYDWHMDLGQNYSTRKISVSIQLSDENDYEGGDLEFKIHNSDIKAPREKGTIVFFPSYIIHRVTKVTKGQRKSLVLWLHGPPFV